MVLLLPWHRVDGRRPGCQLKFRAVPGSFGRGFLLLPLYDAFARILYWRAFAARPSFFKASRLFPLAPVRIFPSNQLRMFEEDCEKEKKQGWQRRSEKLTMVVDAPATFIDLDIVTLPCARQMRSKLRGLRP